MNDWDRFAHGCGPALHSWEAPAERPPPVRWCGSCRALVPAEEAWRHAQPHPDLTGTQWEPRP